MYPLRILVCVPHDYLLIAYEKVRGKILKVKPPEEYKEGTMEMVLVYGHRGYWNYYKKIADSFSNRGYRVHTEWGFDKRKTAQENSKILGEYILKNDLSDVVLIGHSKGGLIVNNLASQSDITKKMNCNVIIASPYHGTIFSRIPFYGLTEFTKEYTESIVPKDVNVRTINIYPIFDNHVIPHSSLVDDREGVTNIEVDVVGHHRILRSEKLIGLLKQENLL